MWQRNPKPVKLPLLHPRNSLCPSSAHKIDCDVSNRKCDNASRPSLQYTKLSQLAPSCAVSSKLPKAPILRSTRYFTSRLKHGQTKSKRPGTCLTLIPFTLGILVARTLPFVSLSLSLDTRRLMCSGLLPAACRVPYQRLTRLHPNCITYAVEEEQKHLTDARLLSRTLSADVCMRHWTSHCAAECLCYRIGLVGYRIGTLCTD